MRSSFSILLIVAILFGSGYLYYSVLAVCQIPVGYRIGELDERFNLSFDEARLAILDAEAIWEDTTGRNLFRYKEDANDLVINFVFDDRQAFADAEEDFREELDEKETRTETINETFAELAARHGIESQTYEAQVRAYEVDLASYNATVEQYNEEGGAPPEVFDELQQQARNLDRTAGELNAEARRLNNLAEEINALGEQGNEIIESYNEDVATYNQTFGESTEFTQGDYLGDTINIYKFSNQRELQLVLAHELGHALGLDHVEGRKSIMYYLMGDQPQQPQLSPTDLDAFVTTCGDGQSFIERLFNRT
ncbi:MAG: matrixin family metalloprotease [Patescibacteria group bacterium]